MTESIHDTQIEISVIVPLFNGERFVSELLESLARQELAPPFEVLVCDNGSTDRSREVVSRYGGRLALRMIDAAERRGQAFARNRGAEHANGRHLLFLDQDDVVDEAYVASMARAMDEYGMAAARVETERLNCRWRGAPRRLAQEARLGEGELGPWGYGGTLGVERSLFSALGGFDESLSVAGEDVDLCWRARAAGQELHYAEAAVLHYRFPGSTRELLRQGTAYGRAHNALSRKWAASGMAPYPRHRAAWRVGYFAAHTIVSRTRAERGQFAFLLGRYWGLVGVRPRRRRQDLRPGERPTVLVLAASDDRRGAEIEATELAGVLRTRGYPASAAALSPGRRQHRLPIPSLGRRPLGPRTLLALRRAASDVDVVIAYGSSTLPACAIALRLTGCPFVYRSISDPARWIRNDLHRRITGMQVRRAVRVVALWPEAAESLQRLYRLPGDRTAVIPNARHAGHFRPPDDAERRAARTCLGLPDRPIVAFVGTMTAEKRVGLAIEAVGRTEDHVLVVAGDGPERAHAERQGAALAAGRVLLLGEVPDVLPVLHAADVVLITSDVEGMPGVAVEAAMCGVPVVATDVGALRSMPGVCVTTAEPDSLAAALQSAAPEPGARRSAPMADRYDWKHVGDVWEDLLGAIARS